MSSRRDPQAEPKRWLELDDTQAPGAPVSLLRAGGEVEQAPAVARARVAARLARSRKRAEAPSPMLRFGIAGAVAGALIVLLAIQLAPSREDAADAPRFAELAELSGQVQVAGVLRATAGDEVAVGARVRVERGASARIAIARVGQIRAAEQTELVLSEIEGAPVVNVARGKIDVDAKAVFGVRAGTWRLRTTAAQFVVEHDGIELSVFVERGEATIDGEERFVLSAGQRFDSRAPVASTVPAVKEEIAIEEEPKKQTARARTSDEELYRRARDESDPAVAIELYDRVAKMRGAYAEIARYQAARVLMKNGRTQEAIARFEKLITDHPNSVYAHETRLDLIECRITTGDLTRARTDLDAFLARYPQSERASELRRLRDDLVRTNKK